MNKKEMYEEFAKRLSKVKSEKSSIIIKVTVNGVKVLACNGYIIGQVLLKAIYDISEKFQAGYYVSSDLDGNPYVMIYL